jgi:RecA-family ATPase
LHFINNFKKKVKEISENEGLAIAKEKKVRTINLGLMVERVEREPKPAMVYSVIKEGSFGIMYGVAKTGKTIFCENLGLSIAAGKSSFFCKSIDINNKKVLFISLEEYYPFRTERNIKQLLGLKPDEVKNAKENFIVATENMPKQFTTTADWNILVEEIHLHKPGVVFIDSLTRIIDGQVENSEVAKAAMLNLRKIAEECKVTLIAIHHSIKIDNQQPMSLSNLAGSRVISQECDFIFGFNKSFENKRYLKLVAARYGNDNSDHVALFNLDENLWCKYEKSVKETDLLIHKVDGRVETSNVDLVYDFIKTNYEDGKVSTHILVNNFVDKGIMTEPTLHKSLGKLISAGAMIKAGHGIYQLN